MKNIDIKIFPENKEKTGSTGLKYKPKDGKKTMTNEAKNGKLVGNGLFTMMSSDVESLINQINPISNLFGNQPDQPVFPCCELLID